jgi:MOSC domain-containing protein YiiM
MPCFKLGMRFEDPRMLKRFAQASRPGAYFRIVTEGELGAGDAIEVVHRPGHGVTVALVSDAFLLDRALIPRVLEAPELAEDLREMVGAA